MKVSPIDIVVLNMLSDGMVTKQIAGKMKMDVRTVTQRIYRIKKANDCTNISHTGLVGMAFRNKILK